MKATLGHIHLCRTANMSWRTCVVVKQIQSNQQLKTIGHLFFAFRKRLIEKCSWGKIDSMGETRRIYMYKRLSINNKNNYDIYCWCHIVLPSRNRCHVCEWLSLEILTAGAGLHPRLLQLPHLWKLAGYQHHPSLWHACVTSSARVWSAICWEQ